jgi:hypothetical protein
MIKNGKEEIDRKETASLPERRWQAEAQEIHSSYNICVVGWGAKRQASSMLSVILLIHILVANDPF